MFSFISVASFTDRPLDAILAEVDATSGYSYTVRLIDGVHVVSYLTWER